MVTGNYFELGTLDAPPGLGQEAVGNEAVMEYIVILEPFGPFPLKIKGSFSN
jgi:hypothetical protein